MQRSRGAALGIICRCKAWNEDLTTSFAVAVPHVTSVDKFSEMCHCHELKGAYYFRNCGRPGAPNDGRAWCLRIRLTGEIFRLSF